MLHAVKRAEELVLSAVEGTCIYSDAGSRLKGHGFSRAMNFRQKERGFSR